MVAWSRRNLTFSPGDRDDRGWTLLHIGARKGDLKEIDLAKFGGEILCQPDGFLCSIYDVKVSNTTDQRVPNNNIAAGVEGFLRQKLSGRGLAFVIVGGSVLQKKLGVGEVLTVDVSYVAAVSCTASIHGEGTATAVVKGPGIVFIQSLPFRRFSQRVARAVTSPNVRENPKFFMQIALCFFLAYVVIVSSLIFTDY